MTLFIRHFRVLVFGAVLAVGVALGADDPPSDARVELCPSDLAGILARLPQAKRAYWLAVYEEQRRAGKEPSWAAEVADTLSLVAEVVTRSVLGVPMPTEPRPPTQNTMGFAPAVVSDTHPLPPFPATFVEGDYQTVDPYRSRLVPWLTARGVYSYSPAKPHPGNVADFGDYRRIIGPDALGRQSGLFGSYTTAAYEVEFWKQVKRGRIETIAVHEGRLDRDHKFRAPCGIYRDRDADHYVLVQNGNYQFLTASAQPRLAAGYLRLYRGIGTNRDHEVVVFPGASLTEAETIAKFRGLHQWYLSSRSDVAFAVPYAGSGRAETQHISVPIQPMVEFDKFVGRFLRPEEVELGEAYVHVLPTHHGNRWSFTQSVAELRFGPHVVAIDTPVTNVRFTSSWNYEAEAHLVDLENFELVADETTRGVGVRRVNAWRRR